MPGGGRGSQSRFCFWFGERSVRNTATGSYLSSFTLAVTEVTERAQLPMLTLSYSDLVTDRGFKYVF